MAINNEPAIRQNFSHAVTVHETMWIPLDDGTRLAARVWLPDDAISQPVPAILEYVPYRRRDGTRLRDDPMHSWFSGHGYACVRVDIRGSGDSDGRLLDEYLLEEQTDGLQVIDWIAAQPWCTGRIGMMGISWGGFNSLQLAALRPEALHAIITSCSTDDRYNDDIHYMGGCVLGDNFSWATTFLSRVSPRAPDPAIVGERWKEMWLERLEHTPLLIERWLQHQRRDDYWKHGSVCESYSDIQCPVFAIGGWNDGYQNAIPRLLENLSCPRIGVIGAWSHCYGFDGGPGPTIGALQEFLRWWDYWLKDIDTGIMNEPMLRAYMEESTQPTALIEHWPGRWISEPRWPVTDGGIEPRLMWLNTKGELSDTQNKKSASVTIKSPLQTGFFAGEWCRHNTGTDLATDQRYEDSGSACFDGNVLDNRLEILGAPVITLDFSVNQPVAQAIVRLNDVAPDGSISRITWGAKNLCQHQSQENPEHLKENQRYTVSFKLNDICYSVLPGHRLRVAISTSYFPMLWPAPRPVTLSIWTDNSRIELPIRTPRQSDELVVFEMPEEGPPVPRKIIEPPHNQQTASFDADTGFWELTITANSGRYVIDDINLETGTSRQEIWKVHPDSPETASAEISFNSYSKRAHWKIAHSVKCLMHLDANTYHINALLDANENDKPIFNHQFKTSVARDHT